MECGDTESLKEGSIVFVQWRKTLLSEIQAHPSPVTCESFTNLTSSFFHYNLTFSLNNSWYWEPEIPIALLIK